MTSGDHPADPFTALAEGAVQLHELFCSFERAGFTSQQALYLVGQVLHGASTGMEKPPENGT